MRENKTPIAVGAKIVTSKARGSQKNTLVLLLASCLAATSSAHFKKFFPVEFCEFCDESWWNLHARLKMFLKTKLEHRPEG